MAKNSPKIELTDEQVEQILFDAMRLHGMLPPSVDEVAALDAELASFELPFGSTDSGKLLKRLDAANSTKAATILPFPLPDTPSARNLARAAREGGELTTETEQQMAIDKAKFLQEENDGR